MKIQTQKFSTGVSVQVLLFGRYFSVLFHRVRFPYVSFSFMPEWATYILALLICFLLGSFFLGHFLKYLLQ